MAISKPTYAAGTVDTEYSLSLPLIHEEFMEPHKLASPTMLILLANQKNRNLGPDGKFHWNIITKGYSPRIGSKNVEYPADDIDPVIQSQWESIFMINGAGTNAVEQVRYNTPEAVYDLVDLKVDLVHRGTTEAMKYLFWSDWNEPGTGINTPSGSQIDIASQLSSLPLPPEELYLYNVTTINALPYSIPMIIRGTIYKDDGTSHTAITGHTLGNIAIDGTDNRFWEPTIRGATGSTITLSDGGTTAGNTYNTDVVTNGATMTGTQALDDTDIESFLMDMQSGIQYRLYIAVPKNIYSQLRTIIQAQNIRQHDSELADLGIRSYITWDQYNAVFYYEPMLNVLWPNSLWAFDPDCLFLSFETAFNPTRGTGLQEWERIPGKNIFGMGIFMSYNLVCNDRRGVGAMHGYTKD